MPIGTPELLIILVIVIIVFGVGRLPQVGQALGRSIREFREANEEKPAAPPATVVVAAPPPVASAPVAVPPPTVPLPAPSLTPDEKQPGL